MTLELRSFYLRCEFLWQKKGMATDAMPIEETFLLFDQAALGTTFDRGDNKLTTTKLTNATLKL